MSLIEADELIHRIRADFPLEPLPQVYGQGYDSVSADFLLKDVPWTQLTSAYVEDTNNKHRCDAGVLLCKVTDEAFCYYLPAYMLMFFNDDYKERRWLFEDLPSYLLAYNDFYDYQRPIDLSLSDAKLKRFSLFNDVQKRDIADFLYHQTYFEGRNLYLNGTYNQWAKRAFDSYWHQFASTE